MQRTIVIAVLMIPLLSFALFFPGCDDDDLTKPRGGAGDAVFPLTVGNKWIYDYAWGSDSVTSTVVIDDKKYYVMRGSSLMIAGMPAYVRLNDRNQLVVRRRIEPEGEYVLFDFDAEPESQCGARESWPEAWRREKRRRPG